MPLGLSCISPDPQPGTPAQISSAGTDERELRLVVELDEEPTARQVHFVTGACTSR